MRAGLSFNQIFPIRNNASALLMRLKADCLFHAGIIDAEDRLAVYARTSSALGFSEFTAMAPAGSVAERSQRAPAPH
jgi:hypothetical protein